MAKMEFTGGHIEIMLFIEITKIKKTGSHIVIMLILEMAKIKWTRGHNRHYANFRDGQNRINRRPYWIYWT